MLWLLRQADACRRGITRHPRFVEISGATIGPGRFVLPDGEPVKGAVLYAQIRTLDCNARSWTSRGMSSREVLEEVLSCAATALGI